MITIAFEKRFKRIAVGISLPLIIQSHPWEPFKKSYTIANGHFILLEVLCITFHCNANGKIVCYKLSELNLTLIAIMLIIVKLRKRMIAPGDFRRFLFRLYKCYYKRGTAYKVQRMCVRLIPQAI